MASGRRIDEISVARVYDEPRAGTNRILVDRLWPRGLAKAAMDFEWRQDLAPSTELRQWYGHDPERFDEFARRYRSELHHEERLEELALSAADVPIVLLTATKAIEHSGAAVLADLIHEQVVTAARTRD